LDATSVTHLLNIRKRRIETAGSFLDDEAAAFGFGPQTARRHRTIGVGQPADHIQSKGRVIGNLSEVRCLPSHLAVPDLISRYSTRALALMTPASAVSFPAPAKRVSA